MKRILAILAVAFCAAVMNAPVPAQEADKPEGVTLFTKSKCNTCHSIDAASVKRLRPVSKTAKHKPPDLSKVGDTRDDEWIVKFVSKEEKIETRSHPWAYKGTKENLAQVAAWLETLKSEGGSEAGSAVKEAKEAKEEAKEAKEEAKEAKQEAKEAQEQLKEHEKADTTHAH